MNVSVINRKVWRGSEADPSNISVASGLVTACSRCCFRDVSLFVLLVCLFVCGECIRNVPVDIGFTYDFALS